ncbi:hypothetical protein [Catenuloplanes japonicus]|uniref:hypothetical protein n=1 Tax=Catenuloplanes japonicus TaxID=33876 RepID=UPI0005276B20|nr:hypothetical protein [Catenuloplanes japonicus]
MSPHCAVCRFPLPAATGCLVCTWDRDPASVPADGRAWDLRAAHLAAGGDEQSVARLRDALRGTRASDDEVTAAGLRARPAADPGNAHALAVTADLLRALLTGELRTVAFLCLLPDGLELHLADVNRFGIARLGPAGRQWPWHDLDPALPADPLSRRFLLAGGIGTVDGQDDPARTARTITAALPGLALPRGCALVLVDGVPGWAVLRGVVAEAHRRYRASATLVYPLAGPARAVVEALVRQSPVGRAHELVLLEPATDGTVFLHPVPVFPEGHRVCDPIEFQIYPPVGAAVPTSLALVVRDAGSRPSAWEPVDIVTADLSPGRPARIGVTLGADARPVYNGVTTAPAALSWPELIRSVPRTLPARPVDVLLAVELCDGQEAGLRLALVRDAITAIANETRDTEWVRVGLLAYGQHSDLPDGEVLQVVGPDRPGAVRAAADGLTLRANRHDYAAAVEDALAAATGATWRPGAGRVLITFGSRPPYPRVAGPERTRPCPAGRDWSTEAARLGRAGVRRIAVWSDPLWGPLHGADRPAGERVAFAWNLIGADGRVPLADATVPLLLGLAGVTFVPPNAPFPYAAAGPAVPSTTSTLPSSTFRRSA